MICRHCDTDVERDELAGHLVGVHGLRLCVLCSRRGRVTEVETGHCCAVCRVRLDDALRDVVDIGDSTAVEPRTGGGGTGGAGLESKPPTDLDRLAPYLADVALAEHWRQPIANVLLDWERIVREDLHLAWIGNATAGHTGNSEAVLAAKSARASVALLRSHLDYITTTPEFPLEDFADQVHACANRMRAFAAHLRSADRIIECPTLTDRTDEAGAYVTCGHPLTVRTWQPIDARDDNGRRDLSIGDPVSCRKCGATRSPEQLIHAAGKEAAWADAEAIMAWYGIPAHTLRRWAARGYVRRSHGRFNVADVEAGESTELADGYSRLARQISGTA